MSKLKHILVPSDGSDDAVNAATLAGELARALDARVTVLMVQSEDAVLPQAWAAGDYPERSKSTAIDDIHTVLENQALEVELPKTASALGSLPAEPSLVHRWGHPAAEICDYADEHDIDLIVMGSHGRTGIRRFLLGSVSQAVSSSAGCSVMIAR